ncbi:peroxisomal coenzyme a diphosphatase peroxisomal [Ilyonectria robusta]
MTQSSVILPRLSPSVTRHACHTQTDYSTSQAAIARFRTYKPPAFPLWDRLPVRKRAAVLILLYADRRGDLRVVITMRAASLRSFSGHAAFPGGKADSTEETVCKSSKPQAPSARVPL